MDIRKEAFKATAKTMIGWLEKRNMEGYYCETAAEAVEAALSQMPAGSTVSWGGTATLTESGMMDALKANDYVLIDRATAKTPEESREIFAKTIMADYYFMSTNAITTKGELVNIDGNANRVACLCHGPSHIMMFVGMNKLTADVESAIKRIRTYACPANATRLNRNTPCAKTGVCAECLSDDCFCNQIVITRRSAHKGRIKVFLIGEDLGF